MQLLEGVHDVIACVAVEALEGDEAHRLALDVALRPAHSCAREGQVTKMRQQMYEQLQCWHIGSMVATICDAAW